MATNLKSAPESNRPPSKKAVLEGRQGKKAESFLKDNRFSSRVQEGLIQMANQNSPENHQVEGAPNFQAKTNSNGLPLNLKAGIEQLSGHSMDDVKVHYNSARPAQFNAHAFARGSEIHLALGQEKHLPHEAWHVVQQKQGRVRPTVQLKGNVNINDDAGLEKEADIMGAKALKIIDNRPESDQYRKLQKRLQNESQIPLQKTRMEGVSTMKTTLKRTVVMHQNVIQRTKYRYSDGHWQVLEETAAAADAHVHPLPETALEGDEFDDESGRHTRKGALIAHEPGALEGSTSTTTTSVGKAKDEEESGAGSPLNALTSGSFSALIRIIMDKTKDFDEATDLETYVLRKKKELREEISNWLYIALGDAGLPNAKKTVDSYTGEFGEEIHGLVLNAIGLFHAEETDDWKENFEGAVEAAYQAFGQKVRLVEERCAQFDQGMSSVIELTVKLEQATAQDQRFVQANESPELRGLTTTYVKDLMGLREHLARMLTDFDFELLFKEKTQELLTMYRVTASFDNNLTDQLVADIMGRIQEHYDADSAHSDVLNDNIKKAIAAVGNVIQLLLNDDIPFQIGLSAGVTGQSDSGVTRRKADKTVNYLMVNVGETLEKLRKNTTKLGIAIPRWAEFGTLFHELSHAIDHDNKVIKGISKKDLDGGHANPTQVYDLADTRGWFYDPDFIAAMILTALHNHPKK